MKRIFLIIVSLSFSVAGIAQTSLEECQKLAARNYPMIRQYDLVEKTMKYSLSDISREWLPKVSLSARASYQSDVASFSDKLLQVYKSMGVDMKGLNKDQYRTEVDITQTIWDGGASRAESRFTLAQGEADRKSVAVDMYAVRGRVNDLFFGALLADAQVRETGLVMNLLAADLEKIKSYLANGTVMQSDADAVEAELLTVKQQMTGLEAAKDSYLAMLSIFTGMEVDSVSVPDEIYVGAMENNRPELSYMESLEDKFSAQEQAVRASTYPRIGLSVQGFYGNPGLNLFKDMMENRWTWNYSAGLRLQWNFGAYYTKRNKLLSLSAAKDRVAVNMDTFLFNSRLAASGQQRTIGSLHDQMEQDDKIIALRKSVRAASESKLENGVSDVTDLLRDITAEKQARLNKEIHNIELLKNIYDLKYTVNE